jgi:hypothetical protein
VKFLHHGKELKMAIKESDENLLKDIVKQAMIELLDERKDLFYSLVAEVIEDAALVRAIREGETSAYVSRSNIFDHLEGEN